MRITYSQDQADFWRCPPSILSVGFKIVETELAGANRGVLPEAIEVPKQRVGKGIAGGVGAAGGRLSADHAVRAAGCAGGWTETEGAVVGRARVLRFAVPRELRSELERMLVFCPGNVVHRIDVRCGGDEEVRSWAIYRSRRGCWKGRH